MKITFETTECGRCDGTGFYAIGSCYGCGGSGRKMTRKGAAARKAVDEKRAEVYSRPVTEIQVGDRVWLAGGGMASAAKFREVLSVSAPHQNGTSTVGGVTKDRIVVDVQVKGCRHELLADGTARVWTAEGAAEVLDFIRARDGKGLTVTETEVAR